MGSAYFFGKIVSMFGKNLFKGKKGTNKILQYMMMSEMFKGSGSDDKKGFSSMLPFMMMSGGNGFSDMFDMFGEDDDDEDDDSTNILSALTKDDDMEEE